MQEVWTIYFPFALDVKFFYIRLFIHMTDGRQPILFHNEATLEIDLAGAPVIANS